MDDGKNAATIIHKAIMLMVRNFKKIMQKTCIYQVACAACPYFSSVCTCRGVCYSGNIHSHLLSAATPAHHINSHFPHKFGLSSFT